MQLRKLLSFGLPLVIGAALVGGVWWWTGWRASDACAYRFLNPHRCEERLRFSNPDFKPTEQAVLKEIDRWKAQGVTAVSVSFRDLRNGPGITVDAGDAYLAMSLYKLPILIRYLKDAEGDPSILDERLPGKPIAGYRNQDEPADRMVVDTQSYAVRYLIENLIWYSDNTAWVMLTEAYRAKHPDYDIVVDTLAELGIVDPRTQPDPRLVSLKSVSSIFRILYNASYLNLEESEYAIELLSRSVYDKGLAAGIPGSVTLANKYGISTDKDESQLHDCGIIYYPDHPYVLCVMTKGGTIGTLEQVIASISKLFYDEYARRYP